MIIKLTRPDGLFIFNHKLFVTNLKKTYPDYVFEIYHQYGTIEDSFKEVKQVLEFDKTDSSTFTANQLRMLFTGVAYNIVSPQAVKELVLPVRLKHDTIATLCFKLFHVAGQVTRHALRIMVTSFKYQYF